MFNKIQNFDYEIKMGDCLRIMRAVPEKSIDMILADLPYGTTACSWDTVLPFPELWECYNNIIKDNGAIVLFGMNPFTAMLIASNPAQYKYDWVWVKNRATRSMEAPKRPMLANEYISVFYKKQPTYNPQMRKGTKHVRNGMVKSEVYRKETGKKTPSPSSDLYYPNTILHFPVVTENVHPTQKPTELCEYLIRTYTNAGETVLDNTMGSGTTGVAAINTGRRFIGIEQEEKYFHIAQQRIEKAKESRNLSLFDYEEFQNRMITDIATNTLKLMNQGDL